MKKLCFTVALMAIALTVCAQAISQQEAMERANSFLNSALKARHQTSSNTQLDAVTVDLPHLTPEFFDECRRLCLFVHCC